MELEWLKKSLGSACSRAATVGYARGSDCGIKAMLVLAITRSVIYAHKKRQQDAVDEDEGLLLRLLDEENTRHPFYGTRRMTQYLHGLGYVINRKRVQRLMRTLGLAGPNTSKQHPQHIVIRLC